MRIAASACGLLAMTMIFCHSEERSDVGIRFFLTEFRLLRGGGGAAVFVKGREGPGSAEQSGERGKRSWSIRSLPDERRVQHGAGGAEA